MITGSESWPGYIVLTGSSEMQLTPNMLHGLKKTYSVLYYTLSAGRYQFDNNELLVEPNSIGPDVLKFYEIQIGRERYCGIEHEKEQRAADAYVLKKNCNGAISLFAVQIQYFIRHLVRVQYRSAARAPYIEQDEWHTFAVVLNYKPTEGMERWGQDVSSPNFVAFQMDLESIQDRYGYDNYIPIRTIAGRFIKVPAVPFDQYIDLKRNKQATKHLQATTGFYCSPAPTRH
jgi:hypothetical protein